jgi:hypothetical protein
VTAWWRGSGADIALPDLLLFLASCERRAGFSRPCGARFTDLVTVVLSAPRPGASSARLRESNGHQAHGLRRAHFAAGDWHDFPLRFDLARQRRVDIADDRLAALVFLLIALTRIDRSASNIAGLASRAPRSISAQASATSSVFARRLTPNRRHGMPHDCGRLKCVGFFELLWPQDCAMSPLGIILVVLLIVLLFGGLGGGSVVPYWGYGYGFGHGGVGVLGIILIVLVVLLLTGRL